jgi:hypothetical protein
VSSGPVELQAGRRYYAEVLCSNIGGRSFVAVKWKRPSGEEKEELPPSCLAPFGAAPSPSGAGAGVGRKETARWRVVEGEAWSADPTTIEEFTTRRGHEGLLIRCPPKVRFGRHCVRLKETPPLARRESATLWLRNMGETACSVAMAFVTPSGYFETRPEDLPGGERSNYRVELRDKAFTTPETAGRYESAAPDLGDASHVLLVVYEEKGVTLRAFGPNFN